MNLRQFSLSNWMMKGSKDHMENITAAVISIVASYAKTN